MQSILKQRNITAGLMVSAKSSAITHVSKGDKEINVLKRLLWDEWQKPFYRVRELELHRVIQGRLNKIIGNG